LKYFTPRLLAQFGSSNNRRAAAASRAWEQAHAKYLRHFASVKPTLPLKLRSLLKQYYLHDAAVLSLVSEKSLFICIELDRPEDESLMLIYKLTEEPEIQNHAVLEEPGAPLQWQYDEISIEKKAGSMVFCHDILFTSGRELKIRFHGFDWKKGKTLLATKATPSASAPTAMVKVG